MSRKVLSVTMAACMAGLLMLTSCGSTDSSSSLSYSAPADRSPETAAVTDSNDETTTQAAASSGSYSFNGQSFVITLHPETAPITCENFENLVSEGFYDGLTFHRVVDSFMAQGGDPEGTGAGGSKDTIKGEFSQNGVENNLSHQRGVVSMARTNIPDSASSQFFICYTDCSFLDGSYAAFGEVTEGMEYVDGFLEVPRSMGGDGDISSPNEPIVIDKAVMIEDDEDGNPRVQFTMK